MGDEGIVRLPEDHLQRLTDGIERLGSSFTFIGQAADMSELIKIIRRPGWTTPAEFLLTTGIVESMVQQATVLLGLHEALIEASLRVGEKERAIAE